MSHTEELKPCPFCGGTDIWHETDPCHYYECKKLSCQGSEKGWHATNEEAIAAWNNRPAEDMLQAKIKELEKQVGQLRDDNIQLMEQISNKEA